MVRDSKEAKKWDKQWEADVKSGKMDRVIEKFLLGEKEIKEGKGISHEEAKKRLMRRATPL